MGSDDDDHTAAFGKPMSQAPVGKPVDMVDIGSVDDDGGDFPPVAQFTSSVVPNYKLDSSTKKGYGASPSKKEPDTISPREEPSFKPAMVLSSANTGIGN